MFGSNSKGKQGLNSNIPYVSEPSLIDSLSKIEVQDIALGYNHAICITKQGELYGWGEGVGLGIGNILDQYSPVQIGICPIENVKCGNQFTLAKDIKGKMWGFGNNLQRQFGSESLKYELFPI